MRSLWNSELGMQRKITSLITILMFIFLQGAGPLLAAPPMPGSPVPADAEIDVPIAIPMQWNTAYTTLTTPASPVKILTYPCEGSTDVLNNFPLAAISNYFTDFTSATTSTENDSFLAGKLADKHVFLMPEQTLSITEMANLGKKLGPVLRQFVQAGGLVIVCERTGNGSAFLNYTGLMKVQYYS